MLKEREGIMHRVRCPRRRGIKDGQEHWPEVGGRVLSLMCQEREQMWGKWWGVGSSCLVALAICIKEEASPHLPARKWRLKEEGEG